jgi:hypothetical protein
MMLKLGGGGDGPAIKRSRLLQEKKKKSSFAIMEIKSLQDSETPTFNQYFNQFSDR